MKYIITTVGASAIEKARIDISNYANENYNYFDTQEEELARQVNLIYERIGNINLNQNLRSTSAEIKSLYKLGVQNNPQDHFVYLLCTDTAACRVCAEFTKRILREKFGMNEGSIEIENIEGLQVTNASTFLKQGLKKLYDKINIEILERINRNDRNNKVIMNITGGFKATIPFITIFCMIRQIPLYYIFEEEENLIKIDPLPINFDLEFIRQNYDLFVEIDVNTYLRLDGLDYQKRKIVQDNPIYFEVENNQVTTSTLADILLGIYQTTLELPRCEIPVQNKSINLGQIPHHGRRELERLAQRVIRNEYVVEVVNSANNQPQRRNHVVIPLTREQAQQHIGQQREGLCIVIDKESDAGYAIIVQTTGRNLEQTRLIANRIRNYLLRER